MRNSLSFSTLAALCSSLFLGVASSQADGFSWSGITYAPTPTVAGQVTSLGNGGGTDSVSIQFVLNNGATFLTAVQSPVVDSYSTNHTYYASGGNADTARFLQVGADMVNSSNGIGSITVNLFFATPITNASFSFFDVDINATGGNPYTDQINTIYGLATDGTTKVPLDSLTGSASNTVSGTGLSYAVTATANNTNNLAAANATASFTSGTPITEISYTYGDAYTGSGTHGTAQITALSNLNFTPVPEPDTWAWIGLGAGGLFLVTSRRHKRGSQSKIIDGL